jgi:hypothetical protein
MRTLVSAASRETQICDCPAEASQYSIRINLRRCCKYRVIPDAQPLDLDKATNRDLDFAMGVFRDYMASARGYIERLGPYQSLLLLSVPTSLVEPLKLIAVAVAGEGHWITGTVMIIVAYGCSLLFVERLFRIVRPKLLSLPWFARLWNWVLVVRGKVVGLFRPG